MDSDQLPPIDYDSLYRTCVHEAAHALRGHYLRWPVLWLRASAPHNGACGLAYPILPSEIETQYARDPLRTRRAVVEVLTVIGAPGQVLCEPLDGGDLETQLVYRFAWEATGSPLPWLLLRHEAQQELRAWANTPGRIAQIARLGALLERKRYMRAAEFQAFVSPPQPQRPPVAVAPQPRAPASPRPAVHVSPAPRAAAPQPQPKAPPQPLEPEDLLWDAFYRPFGLGLGLVRW
jgi:hypothetical protein